MNSEKIPSTNDNLPKSIIESANSPENEMVLAFKRLRHPFIREKFLTHLQKAHEFHASKYGEYKVPSKEELAAALDFRMKEEERVTFVDHENDMPNTLEPLHLGWKPEDGHKLTTRDWSMIEAHEKGHVVRIYDLPYLPNKPHTPDNIDHEYFDKLFSDAIDTSIIPFPLTDEEYQKLLDEGVTKLTREEQEEFLKNYLKNGVEILERMSQLKNYFGMKGDEVFTKEHLDYARKHYGKDRYDNIVELFKMVTPEKEERFLELINSVGV